MLITQKITNILNQTRDFGHVLKVTLHCNLLTNQKFFRIFPGFYPGVKDGTKTS